MTLYNPDPWDWVVLVLAVWRLSSLISSEAPFAQLREWMGVTHDEDGNRVGDNGTWWAAGVQCLWCVSIWVAPVCYLLWTAPWPLSVAPLLLSLSAGAILMGEVVNRLRGE